ncbi:MAG: hypothetical protein A4S09_15270 [Proteobacteria bacterium SG_bin7]|nr:MAG: hypothetical protein A4S09_15270 [Proteobacteria bacterium SG_bin7]
MIERWANHPRAGWFLFAYAVAATIVETVPVTFILSVFAMKGRQSKWRVVALSSVGSALGALLLAGAFHLWGFMLLSSYYPDLVTAPSWTFIESWVAKYGMFAIAGIAAVPLPLTPALALCGLMRMPLVILFASVLIGKFLKYSLTVGFAFQASKQFRHYIRNGTQVKL